MFSSDSDREPHAEPHARTPAENPTWQRPLCNLLFKKYNLVQLTLVFYAWQFESKKRILELDFLHIFHFLIFFCFCQVFVVYLFTRNELVTLRQINSNIYWNPAEIAVKS